MKLKNIVGVVAGLATTMLLTTVVFAAPSVKMGNPVSVDDVDTELTEFAPDDIVAIPIFMYTDSADDVVNNFSVSMTYDSTILEPVGIPKKTAQSLGDTTSNGAGITGYHAVTVVQNADEDTIGSYSYSQDTDKHVVGLLGASMNTKLSDTLNGNKIGYIFFTVKASVEDLNKEIVTVYTDGTSFIKVNNVNAEFVPAFDKFNACAGAFNIKIDATELTSYVQKLYVQIGDAEAVSVPYYTVDGDIYKFPVRVLTTKADASVDVKVLADTSSDLDGKNDAKSKVSLGTITVTLNSPSDYVDSTIS